MSEDEVMVAVVSSLVALFAWVWWYGSILVRKTVPLSTGKPPVVFPLIAPPVALAILLSILKLFAAHDVRDAGEYLFMYAALGCGWTGVIVTLAPLLGFSLRNDVLRYRNSAVAIVLSGWVLAVMLSFAGGNVGDGPHWGVVVLSASLATGTLILIVALFMKLSGNHDALTIDRDVATGIRLAALMISCGAILGTSVAGDWVSFLATLRDFAFRAWTAVLLLVIGLIAENTFRISHDDPRPSPMGAGIMPALVSLTIGAVTVALVSVGWLP